jgi:O-succinylbenzoate synthase
VSSALESSVGLRAGVALAAALPELPYACGLNTATMFTADVTADPLVAVDGAIPVREVTVDGDGWRAGAEVTARWLARWQEFGPATRLGWPPREEKA